VLMRMGIIETDKELNRNWFSSRRLRVACLKRSSGSLSVPRMAHTASKSPKAHGTP